MASPTLTDKILLVTGGGSGIGRSCCVVGAREGAKVVVTDINIEAAQQTLSLLPDPNQHLALNMDVSNRQSIESAFSTTRQHFSTPPTLLVNSAAVGIVGSFLEADEAAYDKQMNVNMKGLFNVCQVFARMLLEGSNSVSDAAIVNLSSTAGKNGCPNISVYSATKGGVNAFTKTIAAELASKGIRVNCVLPSLIDTPIVAHMEDWKREAYNKQTPLGRIGTPQEVAEAVVFLLSPRSSYMVGTCIEVSGGHQM